MRTRVGWGVEDFCRWVGALNFVLLSLQSPGFELSGRDVRGSGVWEGQLCTQLRNENGGEYCEPYRPIHIV